MVCLLIFFKVPVIISHAYNLTTKNEREIEMEKQLKTDAYIATITIIAAKPPGFAAD